jgi:hypothetical protein
MKSKFKAGDLVMLSAAGHKANQKVDSITRSHGGQQWLT